MTDLKLTIELVPSTSWGNNIRAIMTNRQWNALSNMVRDRAWGLCEICGNESSDCHEIWYYNERTHIQKLTGLLSLCQDCHMVKHYGLARIKGLEKQALHHLMKVNEINKEDAKAHVTESFKVWRDRSNYDWKLDISYLKRYGIDPDKL